MRGLVKETQICHIDLENSKIYYRGYDLEDLTEKSSFEETVFLLWHGRPPTAKELAEFKKTLSARRKLPLFVEQVIKTAPISAEPIDVLRTAVSALAWGKDLSDKSPEAELARGLEIAAAMPSAVAMFHRLRSGGQFTYPEAGSHAEYFLKALLGDATPLQVRAMDVMLIIYAEHSMNNSAFTAVTVGSTLADMYAAITAAIASLKGPLHGGANVDAAKMIEEIGKPQNVENWVEAQLKAGRRIPGLGHRLYKRGPDPRLKVLRGLAKKLAEEAGDATWFEIAQRLEEYVGAKLSAKGIFANTDLYAAVIFRYLRLPVDINLPAFAISRVAGWVAHVVEYRRNNRLIRPTERYNGPLGLKYVPIEERG